jgi:acetylcholinesterase
VQSNALLEGVYRDFLDLTNTSSLAELRALSSEEVIRANKQQIAYNPVYIGYSPLHNRR